MKSFKALVLAHYDFENTQGKEFQGTKFLVDLGNYGTCVANGPYVPSLDEFTEVEVTLTYKVNKFKVTEVIEL